MTESTDVQEPKTDAGAEPEAENLSEYTTQSGDASATGGSANSDAGTGDTGSGATSGDGAGGSLQGGTGGDIGIGGLGGSAAGYLNTSSLTSCLSGH